MQIQLISLLTSISLLVFSGAAIDLYARNNPEKKDGTERVNDDKKKNDAKKDKKLVLTVHKVVEYLLQNNYDVKKALLDYKGASSQYLSFQSRYDFTLYGGPGYSYRENPDKRTHSFQGEKTTTINALAGIRKAFKTGTSVDLKYNGILYQNIEGAGFGSDFSIPGADMSSLMPELGGKGYQTGFKVEVSQELLKNVFGINDSKNEQAVLNQTKIIKQRIKWQLAGEMLKAVTGYWQLAVTEEQLKTTEISLESTRNIRDLIGRKLRLGLSEREDLADWNGKVLDTKNRYENHKQALFDARLDMVRVLDLKKKDFEIKVEDTFVKEPPEVTYEQALKDAFVKRLDWQNQRIALRNAELGYEIASNELMPSVKLKLGAGNADFDDKSYSSTFNDLNTEYSVGLELSYPIENTGARVKLRNARLDMQKQKVELQNLEKKIKDEIKKAIMHCEIAYNVYVQTKKAREYKQNYYYQVLKKFQRGSAKYGALQVKLALDGYITSRHMELSSLVNYNSALLKRDLARNVIFENFNIDIDAILKRAEN